jgi:hypothetical protein
MSNYLINLICIFDCERGSRSPTIHAAPIASLPRNERLVARFVRKLPATALGLAGRYSRAFLRMRAAPAIGRHGPLRDNWVWRGFGSRQRERRDRRDRHPRPWPYHCRSPWGESRARLCLKHRRRSSGRRQRRSRRDGAAALRPLHRGYRQRGSRTIVARNRKVKRHLLPLPLFITGLLLPGCTARHEVIAVSETNLGVDVGQTPSSQTPHLKFGFQRVEAAIVPTNRSAGEDAGGTPPANAAM